MSKLYEIAVKMSRLLASNDEILEFKHAFREKYGIPCKGGILCVEKLENRCKIYIIFKGYEVWHTYIFPYGFV